MVANEQIELNAFCIMSNHVHLIWQPLEEFNIKLANVIFVN